MLFLAKQITRKNFVIAPFKEKKDATTILFEEDLFST